uniref:Uncharacterized protein n=1 Tax=Anopheles arabiensis TaxID=7173 RepID=A0A182ID05_ANOAR
MKALPDRIAALEARFSETNVTDDFKDPPLFFTKQDGSEIDSESLGKIPGVVKDFPIFCGDPSELNSWINDVDGIIRLYQTISSHSLEKQNKFNMIFKFVRRKIRGEANDALVASNIQTDDRFNHPEASKALIGTYNKKAMDAFIRGLDGEVYKFI